MSDVLITPASKKIEFKDGSSNIDGFIKLDTNDNLVISSVNDLVLGDGSTDLHIGDGTNSIDMVFDQAGRIYSAGNKHLTIGKSSVGGNDVVIDSPNWSVTDAGAVTLASITLGAGAHSFNDIDIGSEFVDTDDHIMSSGAIKEKIESYNYLTSVDISGNTNLAVSSPITLSGDTVGLDDPINLTQLTESTDATDDKILLWDESASSWKYMTLDDLQDSIDTTGGGGGGGISDILEDTSPQLGGDLDTNSRNIKFDDDHGIHDDDDQPTLIFRKLSASNSNKYLEIHNGLDVTTSTGTQTFTGPKLRAVTDDGSVTHVGMQFETTGRGQFTFINDIDDTSHGPTINLWRRNFGEADNDPISVINFKAQDSNPASTAGTNQANEAYDYNFSRTYARIRGFITDTTDGTADGRLTISALVNDSQTELFEVGVHQNSDTAAGVSLIRAQILTKTGTTNALSGITDAGRYLLCGSGSAACTLQLQASPGTGEQYVFISNTTGTVTIQANGSDTINGSTNDVTITTKYNSLTCIALSTSAWVAIG